MLIFCSCGQLVSAVIFVGKEVNSRELDDEGFEIILPYGPRSSLAHAAYPLFWRKNKRQLDLRAKDRRLAHADLTLQ